MSGKIMENASENSDHMKELVLSHGLLHLIDMTIVTKIRRGPCGAAGQDGR